MPGGRSLSGNLAEQELLIYEDWSVDNGFMEAARSSAPLAVETASAPSRYLLRLASDERLVARVRAGSEQAFSVLFERHHRGILSFCRHMLGSREEAEDAVQQSFVNAYRGMLGSDREINLRPWLYRIARNQCISVLRARRYDVELTDSEPSLVGLSDQVAQRDQLRDLLRDLAGLPVDQREALVLTELHDNSHVEVAAILGCEREKVKSLVFQARSSLIQSREARDISCEEIRRQLSVLRGGALRRNTIRRHLQHCDGCRAFRNEVKQQRQALAVLLSVVPSAALKVGAANAMAAVGAKAAASAIGGGVAGGSGIAAGGAVATGGASVAGTAGPVGALAGKLGVSALAVKGAAATIAVTVAAGGGAVAVKETRESAPEVRPAPIEQPAGGRTPPGGAKGPGGAAAVVPAAGEAAERVAARRDHRRLRKRRGRIGERRRGAETGGKATPMGPRDAGERARRGAERREATRQRKLERRRQRGQAERPRRVRKKRPVRRRPSARRPEPRETQTPPATTPVSPPPDEPLVRNIGPTFPSR